MNLPVGLLLTEKKQNKPRAKINGPDKVIAMSQSFPPIKLVSLFYKEVQEMDVPLTNMEI